MLVKVIPVFENMYKSFGNAKMPGPTVVVINMSHGLIRHWYIPIGLLVGLAVGIPALARKPKGRIFLDKIILRIVNEFGFRDNKPAI